MKKIIDYMKNMFQKVEQEPTRPLLRGGPSPILPMAKKVIEPKPLIDPTKVINPSDVYEEDISDRVGHVNFNKIRRFKESGGQITRIFYKESDLID